MDEGGQGHLTCLDSNHSHFILVDDGTHGHRHVAKSRDWSDAGTSQESGIHQSWRRQGVQLLQGNPAIAIILQSYGRGQFGPSSMRQAHTLLDSGSA